VFIGQITCIDYVGIIRTLIPLEDCNLFSLTVDNYSEILVATLFWRRLHKQLFVLEQKNLCVVRQV